MVPLVADIFSRHGTAVELLVEPFAGGAGVSIALLESGLAKKIALADKDIYVSSFWRVVFSDQAKKLVRLIEDCDVSLSAWDEIKRSNAQDDLNRAFRCLYLNRTSFSGILHSEAGPIGGRSQSGSYKIGCRFNKKALIRRIMELSDLRSRVLFVRTQSYRKTISDIKKMKISRKGDGLYWYFDPPFFEKANKLYREFFDENDHLAFKESILSESLPGQWVLSYDDVKIARDFYSQYSGFSRVNLSYNARIDSLERLSSSEIIVSNIIASLRERGVEGVPRMGRIVSLSGLVKKDGADQDNLWEAV